MKKNKKAFTLIEVLMATMILTIAVFGVYRLIGENTKIIGNSNNYLQANNMITPLIECIENIGFNTFKNSTATGYYFNFGSDSKGCFTGTTNSIVIDNIEYDMTGKIIGSGSTYIDWELGISTDTISKILNNYRQIKN